MLAYLLNYYVHLFSFFKFIIIIHINDVLMNLPVFIKAICSRNIAIHIDKVNEIMSSLSIWTCLIVNFLYTALHFKLPNLFVFIL